MSEPIKQKDYLIIDKKDVMSSREWMKVPSAKTIEYVQPEKLGKTLY